MSTAPNAIVTEADLDALEAAIRTVIDVCHRMNAKWWIDPETGEDLRGKPLIVPTKLMLVVSEISEAMEGDRTDAMDDKLPHRKAIEVELADALIRIADLAGAQGYDVAGATREKTGFNAVRSDHSHEVRKKSGGKKY